MTGTEVLKLARVRRLAREGIARRVRLDAGLSLADVAEAVGVAVATLSRWEHGVRRPTGEPALRYADLLAQLERVGAAC